jgi:hypothetical protein
MPLDRIVHAEIMATNTIPAELPDTVNWKMRAKRVIEDRYSIKVEHLRTKLTFEQLFYKKWGSRSKKQGQIYGWPLLQAPACQSQLKMPLLRKLEKGNLVYVGICVDEPTRLKSLSQGKVSPLEKYNINSFQTKQITSALGLLSPSYEVSNRDGCWFCHNQPKNQLRQLFLRYPSYWKLMLQWDKDSPTPFRQDGTSIEYWDWFFTEEKKQLAFLEDWGK